MKCTCKLARDRFRPFFRSALLLASVGALCLAPAFGQDSDPKLIRAYETTREIAYVKAADADAYARDRCKLDLYVPKGARDFPTIVWFHGGGLTGGSKSVPRGLQEKGFAVVAPNYRLSPAAKSPAYVEDAAAAVAWTFENIEKFGGSNSKIVVGGISAGGYLSLMIGLDKSWLSKHGIDADSIAALAPISGQAITHYTVRAERGISDKQPVIDKMAPLYHVRADAPPILLVTGDPELEMLGRAEENAYLARMLKVAGHKRTTLHRLDGFDHGGVGEASLPLVVKFVRSVMREIEKDSKPANASKAAAAANYRPMPIDGWTVRVHPDLLDERNEAATSKALKLLKMQLNEISKVVPAVAVEELRKVPLWFSPEYQGVAPKAEYHPDAGWLRENGRNVAMAKGVEFTNVRIFERETARMPNFALHELAHAYHDRVLPGGFGNAEIAAAFERAKAQGNYDQVERRFGDGRTSKERSYGMTNPMEYFAEVTESYFSTNDFFPFTKVELEKHDPEAAIMLKKLWQVAAGH